MSKMNPREKYRCMICSEIFADDLGTWPHDSTPGNVECPKCGEEKHIQLWVAYYELKHAATQPLCGGCPPVGYPTDETRCAPCPRRADAIRWGEPGEMTHAIIDGVCYVKNPSGTWRPDYSDPGTADKISKSVDAAYDAHWSIDKWRK